MDFHGLAGDAAAELGFGVGGFEHLEVGGDGGDLHGHGGGDRAAGVMGRDLDVVRLGGGGDLADLGDAAGVGEVGLDEGGALAFEQFAVVLAAEELFAAGDGGGHARGEGAHGLDVFGGDGFFQPDGTGGGKGLGGLDGEARGEAFGALDVDLEVGAGGLADALHKLGGEADGGHVGALAG